MRSAGSLRTLVRQAAFVWVCTAGCSDATTTEEPGEKTFDELSNIEVRDLCPGVRERVLRLVHAFDVVDCTLLHHESTTCEADRKVCLTVLSDMNHSGANTYSCDDTNAETAGAACREITVSEYDACLDATLMQMETLAESLSCASPASALEAPAVPQACAELGERCPALSGQ